METYARNFVRLSLIWFLVSAALGVGMAVDPSWAADYTQVHVHFMLLGWMSMMIFGVGYHILPRFQGHTTIPRTWAWIHFYLSNAGLLLMGTAWWSGRGAPDDVWKTTLISGGILSVAGFLIFIAIIFSGLRPVKRES